MSDAIAIVNRESALRAMLLTGSGTKVFCAGADLYELLAKFIANVRYAGMAEPRASRLAEEIMKIDGADDIAAFSDSLGNIGAN